MNAGAFMGAPALISDNSHLPNQGLKSMNSMQPLGTITKRRLSGDRRAWRSGLIHLSSTFASLLARQAHDRIR